MTDVLRRPKGLKHAMRFLNTQEETGIREYLVSLETEIVNLREWNAAMVEKAASGGTLDAYREQGAKMAAMAQEIDELKLSKQQILRLADKLASEFDDGDYDTIEEALDAFKTRVEELGGAPVVVNVGTPGHCDWGSDSGD